MPLNHLNLVVRDVVRSATFWEAHFGFDPVRGELDWRQEDGYVSVKVADPDGYVVEVFWER